MERAERIRELMQRFGRFVHMMPNEVPIWARWLEGEGARYAPYEYDVAVGEGVQLPEEASELERRIAAELTRKRIDAVSRQVGVVRIFEVKPRAGLSAVGQLLGYRELYRQTFRHRGPIELWLITDRLQPDMEPVLRRHGIIWREVGEITE